MGPTFPTILNKFYTDFLQFSAEDGGVLHPPHPPPSLFAPLAVKEEKMPKFREDSIPEKTKKLRNMVYRIIKGYILNFTCFI